MALFHDLGDLARQADRVVRVFGVLERDLQGLVARLDLVGLLAQILRVELGRLDRVLVGIDVLARDVGVAAVL